jgi:hypothetical protein
MPWIVLWKWPDGHQRKDRTGAPIQTCVEEKPFDSEVSAQEYADFQASVFANMPAAMKPVLTVEEVKTSQL